MNTLTLESLFTRLPITVRREMEVLSQCMSRIDGAHKKDPVIRALAGTSAALGLSFDRLRSIYFRRWRASGCDLASLVNHNKCGGCGLEGCGKPRELDLPQSLVEEWLFRAGENKKDALKRAHQTLISALSGGERLPCLKDGALGTWVELFAERWPMREIPVTCPWSPARPPAGWSLSNFRQRPCNEAAFILHKNGYFDAVQHLPEVRLNVAALRPLELIVFDDCDLDFRVMVEARSGVWQAVRLKGLFCMDVATRCILSFCLRPEMLREDGTKIRWTLRDMHHLMGNVLVRYGMPVGYNMEVLIENGTATLEESFRDLMARLTRGRVLCRTTGMIRGDLAGLGYRENSGNPRGKPWLESFFRLLHRVLGAVQGQTGSSYADKDGDHEGRLQVTGRLSRILSALSARKREELLTPFTYASEGGWIVQHAIEELNNRVEHDLTGFEKRAVWRFSDVDEWKPALLADATKDQRRHVLWFNKQPEETKNELFYCDKSKFRWIMESPAQRWARLCDGLKFDRIAQGVFIDLMLDCVKTQYLGGDVIDLKIGRGSGAQRLVRWRGEDHRLAQGDEVLCRLNTDSPESGVWFQDAAGRYLGTMSITEFPEDRERLLSDLGARQKAHAAMVAGARKIIYTPERITQQIQRLEESTEVIAMVRRASAP